MLTPPAWHPNIPSPANSMPLLPCPAMTRVTALGPTLRGYCVDISGATGPKLLLNGDFPLRMPSCVTVSSSSIYNFLKVRVVYLCSHWTDCRLGHHVFPCSRLLSLLGPSGCFQGSENRCECGVDQLKEGCRCVCYQREKKTSSGAGKNERYWVAQSQTIVLSGRPPAGWEL